MNPHTSAPPLSNPYPPHSNSSPVYGGTHQPPYQNSAPQQTWGAQPQYGSLPSTYMNPPPPYHAQPAFATQPPVPQTMLRSSLTKFVKNQRVRVCLTTNVWAAGVILSALQFCQQIFGLGYLVEYIAPDTNMRTTGEFPPSSLSP